MKLLLLLFFLLNPALQAKDAPLYTARQVFNKMIKAQDSQRIMKCDLVKEDKMDSMDSMVQSSVTKGKLIMRRGGYALLNITEPARQQVVSDGKTLWMVMPEVQQVMKYDVAMIRQTGNFFLDIPASIRYYAKNSLKRLIPAGDEYTGKPVSALELDPDDPQTAGFTKMNVWVDHEKWEIRKILLHTQGLQMIVRFENLKTWSEQQVKRDPELDVSKKVFQYKVPDDFQVFDLMAQ